MKITNTFLGGQIYTHCAILIDRFDLISIIFHFKFYKLFLLGIITSISVYTFITQLSML